METQTQQEQQQPKSIIVKVSGVQHSDYKKVIDKLVVGDYAVLLHNPWNEYDLCAIEVWCKGARIGFLPANSEAQKGAIRKELTGAQIKSINKEAKPWEMLTIELFYMQNISKEKFFIC